MSPPRNVRATSSVNSLDRSVQAARIEAGAASNRARVSGPAPNRRSTLLALRSAASSACIAAAFGPSSSMSPMTAMRRPFGPGFVAREQRKRRAHRSGIGVVAFVDDGRRAVGHRQEKALPPALLRRERAKRRGARPQGPRRARPPREARRAHFPPYALRARRVRRSGHGRERAPSRASRSSLLASSRSRPSHASPRPKLKTRAPCAFAAFARRSNCGASRLRIAVP